MANLRGSLFLAVIPVFLLSLTACTMAGKPAVGKDLSQQRPAKLLYLPAAISISEISASGMTQEDPEWSKQGKAAIDKAVRTYFMTRPSTSLVDMPQLSEEQDKLVHDHVLLYDVVAQEAFIATNVPAAGWGHLAENFQYSLGPGLRFLKETTGADAALIVIGSDNISTGGRKTMVAMAALVGVGMPLGSSVVSVGVIDLEDGDILWFQHSVATGNLDLRQPGDATTLFAKAMEGYGD